MVCPFTEWRGSQIELEKAEESQNGRPEMGKVEDTPTVVPMQVIHNALVPFPKGLGLVLFLFIFPKKRLHQRVISHVPSYITTLQTLISKNQTKNKGARLCT